MSEAVIRAPREPEARPATCPMCRTSVMPRAKKCGQCGEWLVSTQLNGTDRVLRALGYLWALLSVVGAGVLWLMSDRESASALGDTSMTSAWLSLPSGVIIALLLQGIVVGLVIVSFAQRGPREATG